MIESKEDFLRYLEADRLAICGDSKAKRPRLFRDEEWRYEIVLRKHEYYHNVPGPFHKLLRLWYGMRHHRLGVKYGYFVPINVCGEGLHINHTGMLIINDAAHIGKNFTALQGVVIGQNIHPDEVPTIGDNVFVGSGAKIFGKVTIADNIAIAAGSVVTKSFETPNVTIGGVPAKVINSKHGNPFARELS
ncbi:hypothetical protein JS532_06980 [Bifidobacterium callimiconis]|uniref:serine O-acetyltransferase n=1 Tax=Bifidobacterium callimiconis TaxID=2306973 RepID=UPI001BDC15F7|nr:DapH/DapD/GlmU-related protein [Bifidobacterium callimiconis]MBT1177309.1 hypothetical protein [Bifidobacterium callimiconis]